MKLPVEHKDGAGLVTCLNYSVSLPAFLKHAALAGQRHSTLFPTFRRGVGLLLFYQDYIRVNLSLGIDGFNRPQFADPTELGDFSTIVGKAFADFLAKRIVGASYTFTYEAALLEKKLPIKGKRPDFFCISQKGDFAIESKGRQDATINNSFMSSVKEQSYSGDIDVKFGYASVSYNLYEEPRCKFHDPVREDAPDDELLQVGLVRGYYESILNEIGEPLGFIRLEGRDFILAVKFDLFGCKVWILIDVEVKRLVGGLERISYAVEPIDLDDFYVDSDGVGVLIC